MVILTLGLLLAACGDSAATSAPATTLVTTNTQSNEIDNDVAIEDTDTGRTAGDRLRFTTQRLNNVVDNKGRAAFMAYEFSARDGRGTQVSRFNKPVKITIRFGAFLPVGINENDLTIVYFNPQQNEWEDVESTVNSANRTITAEVNHFSKYGVSLKGGSATTVVTRNGTPVAAGAGAAGQITVSRDGTPIGGGAAAGGIAVKGDVTNALNVFSTTIFGRTYSYTDTGGATAAIIGTAIFPNNDKGVLTANFGAAGVAAYGRMSNGLEVVMAGTAGVAINDMAAEVAAGGLAEVAFSGYAAPTSQQQALNYINEVAPGLSNVGWTVRTTERGSYYFYATGTKTINTAKGPVNAKIGALASVVVTQDGKAVVAVQVGTGTKASLVK
jgi:hypothetical protein